MEASDWNTPREYEAQHFGFLPKGFADAVYNLILEKWKEIVEKEIMSTLLLDDINGEMKLSLEVELLSMICKNNVLNSLMNKLEKYTVNYVFRIPNEVTLPEDKPNLEADRNWNLYSVVERRKNLEREIVTLRLANSLLDTEIGNNQKAIMLMSAIEQSLRSASD